MLFVGAQGISLLQLYPQQKLNKLLLVACQPIYLQRILDNIKKNKSCRLRQALNFFRRKLGSNCMDTHYIMSL